MPADLQMILWAGGLYGLNDICKSSLSQAAGSIVGSASMVEKPKFEKPLVGMTSLGKSTLSYMVYLKPELEKEVLISLYFIQQEWVVEHLKT